MRLKENEEGRPDEFGRSQADLRPRLPIPGPECSLRAHLSKFQFLIRAN